MSDPVELVLADGVAHLTLNRPDAANTIDLALARRFRQHMMALERERPAAVVIAARGRAFCGGGDVREMSEAPDLPAYLDLLAGTFHNGLLRLASLDALIIAAIDGAAAGGGLGLALNADVRIASTRARFLTAYEAVGLTPDSGVSYLLPRIVGLGLATEMSALSRTVDSVTAARCGLVAEIVESDPFARAVELASSAARQSQAHMSATRRLLRGDTDGQYLAALDAERTTLARGAASTSAVSLIRGFAHRQKEKQS
ncbi:2-(1,2-epoxy-1,2-dihydrophenyl)acetyl-CoA isomerase [Microbacterium trichothecenolyticum]|uniref:enoyl-CoA hydratase/isomerase family protein n=1 Tax=Microbacterium trichothecenolyticum TaxID=69370 RepID=UPI0028666BDD|nr:enoyl-CoA hydratase/isomerase family protein [Microbacterium trichothecenolyticum]MDR7112260.1 2-(1,2-epoxy-1,2-dihydrophenyl)acetyl-CoA isomerase [Microbacterium trichothecenolyticum]